MSGEITDFLDSKDFAKDFASTETTETCAQGVDPVGPVIDDIQKSYSLVPEGNETKGVAVTI